MPTDKEIEAAARTIYDLYPGMAGLHRLKVIAKAALEAAEAVRWQPMETAPKTEKIIVYRPIHDKKYIPKIGIDYWYDNRCWGKSRTDTPPIMWQPLPEPPNPKF